LCVLAVVDCDMAGFGVIPDANCAMFNGLSVESLPHSWVCSIREAGGGFRIARDFFTYYY
jgi:hypothetical protein